MTVYIAIGGYYYEAYNILGVFRTREDAEKCNEDHPKNGYTKDYYDIQEHELK